MCSELCSPSRAFSVRDSGVAGEGSQAEGIRHHQTLLDQIRRHDVDRAGAAMPDHMDSSERILEEAIRKLGKNAVATGAGG